MVRLCAALAFSFFTALAWPSNARAEDDTELKARVATLERQVRELQGLVRASGAEPASATGVPSEFETGCSIHGGATASGSVNSAVCATTKLQPGSVISGGTIKRNLLNRTSVGEVLSGARAVPYFRGGVPVGMRFFAIKHGSAFEAIGLKNGDVVKALNGERFDSADKFGKMLTFEHGQNVNELELERAGESYKLRYAAAD